MVRFARIVAVVIAIPIVCAPLAFLLTVLCAPLWERFEAATSIQSYGHHGPVEWCYVVTFAVLAASGYISAVVAAARRSSRPNNSSKPTPLRGAA